MMHGREFFYNNHWMDYSFFSNGWNWLIGIGVLLLVAAVIYLVVKRNKKPDLNSEALELLKIKYAKGEITEEEYTNRKNILED